VKAGNAEVTAQAVRKESKSAGKLILRDLRLNSVLFAPAPLLLPITTLAFVQVSQRSTLRLMGRLSYIRHKNKQESSFGANGFVNGIQVSFADSQTNSFINHVLSANGLSNVIPTSSRKVER
jgi:hypothetical protein